MKIVCDNCATKYSIADEKVRGKVFKIRCKKCSHIIVVRGGADGNAEVARAGGGEGGPDGSFPGDEGRTVATQPSAPDAVWHLVIDREQVGPMTVAEVRQKLAVGEIDVETYAWREGFGDWLRLGSIDDFRDAGGLLAGSEGATTVSAPSDGDLFAHSGGGDDGGGEATVGGELFAGAAAAHAAGYGANGGGDDAFANGGNALFGAPAAAPAARPARSSAPAMAAVPAEAAAPAAAASDGGARMTGQRSENSVLFSLNNLQALATGGPAPSGSAAAAPRMAAASAGAEPRPGFASQQTEGSGLIDIRAMAASTLATSPSSAPSSRPDDLPGLGAAPVFTPMAAPILMPAASAGPPKWMYGVLAVGVLAVVGIVVAGVLILTKPAPTTPPAGLAVNTPPAAANPAAAAPNVAPPPTTPAANPPPANPTPANPAPANPAAEDPNRVAAHHPVASSKRTTTPKATKPDAPLPKDTSAALPPPTAPSPPPKKATGSSKHDELDDLLNGGNEKPKKASHDEPAAGGDDNLPETLDKSAVVGAMQRVKPRVIACYDQFKVPGMVMVNVTIAGSGHVSNAGVSGSFAGTPTGDCVTRAVRGASFPRFKGANQAIQYPFILR